jgi:hypothetical protein
MIIVKGHPNLVNMHSYKKIVETIAVLVFNIFASTHLVASYVAIKIYLFLTYLQVGLIGPTKSSPHFINGSFGRLVTSFRRL